jgi:hypothetical protein
MHRSVYTLGDDVVKLCEAQFHARGGADVSAELERQLDAGAPKYVRYVMQMVQMLRDEGVEPYMVFDGAALPAKGGTDESRFECVTCAPSAAPSCTPSRVLLSLSPVSCCAFVPACVCACVWCRSRDKARMLGLELLREGKRSEGVCFCIWACVCV